MKQAHKILLITLAWASVSCGANNEQVDDALTKDQLRVARQYAADFGIQNIKSISYVKRSPLSMMGGGDACVIGDETLTNSIGRYKQLYINCSVMRVDPPEPFRKQYYNDCTLTIQSFVDFELRGEKIKVLVSGADPELALNTLHKAFSDDYAVDYEVSEEKISLRLQSGKPARLIFYCPWWDDTSYAGDCYRLTLDPGQDIWFTVDGKKILVRDPDNHFSFIRRDTDDKRIDDALSKDQLKIARQYAADFGIQHIKNISYVKKEWHTKKGEGDIRIIGDETSISNIGRYKQLYITDSTYDTDPPEPLRNLYHSDCALTMQSFVEFELRGDKVRVLVNDTAPELALVLLPKLYAYNYVVDKNINEGEILQRLQAGTPRLLDFRFPWFDGKSYTSDYYKLELDGGQSIYFTVDDKNNIVIRDPESLSSHSGR